jgi:regulator of protease activity HflC (stomatin/prohibitin superfamily)
VARLPADEMLRAAVNRDAAAAIARERLAAMDTGLTIDQLTLEEVSVPASVADSFEAVISAETERSQRIVTAEQERARILGETAGEANRLLLDRIDACERAETAGLESEAAALEREIDAAIDGLAIDGLPIGGEVAKRINAAKTHRSRVVEEVRADREAFVRLLPEYERHPRLVQSTLQEASRAKIFTGDVETFYTAPGRLELQINRDPAVLQQRQREQLRSRGPERPER